MDICRDADAATRAYPGAMNRAALLVAGLLTFAACSSGGEAEPPPPLDTEAPSTTVEPPPTTEAPATTTTSTTVAETTTTASTEPPVTVPIDEAAPRPDNPAFADAFESYELAWAARRAAVASPEDPRLRDELAGYYSDAGFAPIAEFLDQLAESDLQAQPNVENPSRVAFVRGEALTADGEVAGITVCEVLTDIGVDRVSGEVVRTQVDAYLNQVFLQRTDETWIIEDETTLTRFPEQADCQ